MAGASPKLFYVWLKGKDGALVRTGVRAADKGAAEEAALRSHYRRQERFPLTFSRLEEAMESGAPGMLAVDPKRGKTALSEAFWKAEIEKRKRDQERYGLKVVKVEEG